MVNGSLTVFAKMHQPGNAAARDKVDCVLPSSKSTSEQSDSESESRIMITRHLESQ